LLFIHRGNTITIHHVSTLGSEHSSSLHPIQTMDAKTKDTDLFPLDAAAGDEAPPPAYGEIHNEQYGLKTTASVANDGRVDIHINQLNRRLSQIFTPSLRQTSQDDQDTIPVSSPYIPISLSGEPGSPPTPPLNVVIQVVGSRGDVQPFIALGKVLKEKYGHRVRLATHPAFQTFVQENGLEFFSIGGDPSRLMAFMVKNPNLVPGLRSLLSGDISQRRKDVSEYIQGCWRSCYRAGDGTTPGSDNASRPFVADAIIANPPSFAHIHCAEKLGVPLHIMFTMPYSPTQAFPHPLANIQSSNVDPRLTNCVSYAMIEVLVWQSLGDIINRFRVKLLGLEPVGLMWAPGMLDRLKVPHTYCWSPALIQKPSDWADHITISGPYLLDSSDYTPEPNLEAFLEAGPPPVYIGFGSIVLDNPRATTELMFEVSRKTGQRLLLFESPGGMSAIEPDPVPDTVFMLGNAPHDWLFKHVSCVVHHGGAGTTMAGIAAGRPTVIVPFFGDQAFWGAMIARVGAGPAPIPQKSLTAENLTGAIDFCLRPETLERAKELALKTAAERGSETGAHLFHEHLTPDRLRCTLAPSRAAVWRIKRTRIKLSAFAVSTLTNANLLDPADLKLFRAQEYETDRGPYDPISGAIVAACQVASGITMGLKDMPSEAYKACQLPFSKDSRQQQQQPQHSASTSTSEYEISETTSHEPCPPPTSSGPQDSTTLDVRDYRPRIRRHTDASSMNSLASSIASMSMSSPEVAPPPLSTPTRHQEKKPNKPSRNPGQFDFSSGIDHDMMSQPGVHTHKGLGRFTKAVVQSPMDMTMGFTKGFHNLPKAWGDDTVRPQPQIDSFLSGAKSAGKEFGLGMYDGITGLVTQPWKGAQKEGVGGFAKGFGKGIGGLVAKPSAAAFGILGYTMKGIHKECQRMSGSSVRTYILASRLAQGEAEWSQSSDAEKEEVIAGWKVLQKYLKKKHSPEEMLRDVLEGQRKARSAAANGHERSVSGSTVNSARLSIGPDRNIVVMDGWHAAVAGQAVEVAELESIESPRHDGGVEWDRVLRLDDEQDKVFEQSMSVPRGMSAGTNSFQHYDSGHLAGTSRGAFEARQEKRQGEPQEAKSHQERTEEEIVLEYIKKQSLVEEQLRNKDRSRAVASANDEDEDDEDLRRALELSMQGIDCVYEM
jgi:UDP:flavonoid glycosyltransferase YjiC (YdhE family)